MSIQLFLSGDFANRLGWTLVHSLWQAAAIAAVLAVALSFLRWRTSQARYAASTGAMALMLVCVGATFFALPIARSTGLRADQSSTEGGIAAPPADPVIAPPANAAPSTIAEGSVKSRTATQALAAVPAPAALSDTSSKWALLSQNVTVATPWLSAAWVIGVLALSVWRFGGWIAAQRLRVLGVRPDAALTAMTERLAIRLGLRRVPTVLQSLLAETPMVIGWLRPVVLVPVAALSGLTPQQLEAVLAHELAHVRRYDYLVNLFQVAAETLLFYHPAVWLISRRIRLEREQCCDDVALSVCQDRCAYASSLAALEEVRLVGSLALAASGSGGSQLLTRVRRVLGIGDDPAHRGARAIAAIVVFLAAAITAAGLSGKSLQVNNEWAGTHGWAAQNVQPTTLQSKLGGWRNLAFSISQDEEADARVCIQLALTSRQTVNDTSEFSGTKTRQALEQILSKRPAYFYAEFLLGLWHRENGDSREADRLMEAAYKNAPVVAVQQFAFADGSALAGVAVQSFALECNRVEHGSLDPTLKLYYPYLHTDARGCIYLPVYNTVLRADQMASPNGCDVAWPKLGWFEISEKVALLPVATVTRHGKGAATPATKGEAAIAEAPPREAPTTRPSLNFGPMLDGLQLALELDAPNGVLPLAEPAKARLHFRNAGQLAIKLKNPTLWQPTSNEFTVTDADGKLVQAYSAWFSGFDVGRVDELQPGQSVAIDSHTVAFYPADFDLAKVPHPVGNYALLKPGKYTVQYKLRCPTLPNEPNGGVAWHDQLATAPVAIEVAMVDNQPEKAAAVEPAPATPATKPAAEPRYIDISGTVVDDATGKPVSNFSVQGGKVDDKDPTKITWGYTLETTTSSNPTARFSSRVQWSGGWRSRIVANGYVGEPILLKLPDESKQTFENVVIRLKRGRRVTGHVLDHTGKPVSDAGVFVVGNPSINLTGGKSMELAGEFHEDTKAVRFATDANGAFTVTGVAEDRRHIAVTCPAVDLWVAEVPKEGGNIEDLTIRLPEPGKLVVHYDIAGAPEKAQIFLQYHTWDLFKNAGVDNHRYAPIRQHEEMVLNNLAPGEYVIDRAKNSGNAYEQARTLLDRRNIKVESGKTVVVDFVRLTGAPIAGQIVGLNDGEVAKAKPTRVIVRVVPVKEDQWRSVVFDAIAMEKGGKAIQSDFITERMVPGQYKLRVQVFVPETQEQQYSTGIVPPAFVGEVVVTVPENGKPEPVKIALKPWVYADGI